MMIALTILIVGTLNIACFFIGAKIGQKIVRGETIEAPNPIKAVSEHREKKEARREQDRIDIIMQNIETYDGTGYGQQDVPKG
jgi:hypothetical protein